jgi:RNA polymerase sigma-70 factor (ECF subfamily)
VSQDSHAISDDRGNRVSFERLYDEHFDAIFRYVLHRVGSVAEAEDLTSQVFFKALRNLWRFRWSGGSFSAWLYRIATNEVHSHFRRHRSSRIDLGRRDPDSLTEVQREALQADRILGRNELFQELSQALRRLKPEEQTLVVLRYLEEKSFVEIAEIVHKRQGAVTMRTHRALEKLRNELERRGVDHERFRREFADPAQARGPGGTVQAELAP